MIKVFFFIRHAYQPMKTIVACSPFLIHLKMGMTWQKIHKMCIFVCSTGNIFRSRSKRNVFVEIEDIIDVIIITAWNCKKSNKISDETSKVLFKIR